MNLLLPRRVSIQNVPVCTFKTSPCVPAPRAHVETHVRVMPATRGRFGRTYGVFTVPHNTNHTTHHTAHTPQHKTRHNTSTRPQHHMEIERDRDRERQRKKTGTEREKRRRQRRDKRREDRRRQNKTRQEKTRQDKNAREDEWGDQDNERKWRERERER